MCGQSVKCEVVYTWILDEVGAELGLQLKNKEISWWACKNKLRFPWWFSSRLLLSYRFGLVEISCKLDLVRSCKTNFVTAICIGPNPEGLIVGHITCNQLCFMNELL